MPWDTEKQKRLALARQKLMSKAQIEETSALCSDSFRKFVREAWHVAEPAVSYIDTWHMDAISDHLQAVYEGQITRLLINIGPGYSKPVDVDALVLMGDGSRKRLGDIAIGDWVIAHTGIPRKVLEVHEQGELECVKVATFLGRSVNTAPDHPFLTTDGWVAAGDLTVGHSVASVARPKTTPSSSNALAEYALAGYFVGDGCTAPSSPNGFFANITSADLDYREQVLHCCDLLGFTAKVSDKTGTVAKMIHVSGGVRPWLEQIGLARKKSATKRVPEFVFGGSNEQIAAFIAAYFQCDGTVRKKAPGRTQPVVKFSSISHDLLSDVQSLLLRFGVRSILRKLVASSSGKWTPAGYVSYSLDISTEHDAALFLKTIPLIGRKRERLKEFSCHLKAFPSSLLADPVSAVAKLDGKKRCRCLTVDIDHSFTVNDLVVHNSLLTSVLWPTWLWIRNPKLRLLCASYAEALALRDAVRARNVLDSPWYRTVFKPEWEWREDQQSKMHYENTESGFRISLSVDGKGTGFRGDCVAGESMVTTNHGPLPIRRIVEERLPVRALGSRGYSKVLAYSSCVGRPSVAISTGDNTLVCTDDHPVFVEGSGYHRAFDMIDWRRDGSLYLRVLRREIQSLSEARGQSIPSILLDRLSRISNVRPAESGMGWRKRHSALSWLRSLIHGEARRSSEEDLLLEEMCREISRDPGSDLRDLPEALRSLRTKATLLFSSVCERTSSLGNPWGFEWALPYGRLDDQVLRGIHQGSQARNQAERWKSLCSLRRGPETPGAPYRWLEDESRSAQPGEPLYPLPSEGPYKEGHSTGVDAPARLDSVRRCATPDTVYNLQTESGDYFANGILTHNCQIIDDPLNAKDRFSDAALDACINWLDQVMVSRFNDMAKGSRVIIMQRLNERDLSGHVLEQGGYEHLMLPSEFEPERRCVTSIGFSDPREEHGELLFPQLFPRHVLDSTKREMGGAEYAGQHQQRPVPQGGGMLRTYWWRYWQSPGLNLGPVPVQMADGSYTQFNPVTLPRDFDVLIQSWDMTFKDTKRSDYVVGLVVGARGADRFILDMERGRWDLPATIAAVRRLSSRWPQATTKIVEDKANGPAVISTLRQSLGGLIAHTPKDSKIARASAQAPQLESGNWYLPHPAVHPWVNDFIKELGDFPAGINDDYVDAWSQAGDRLRGIQPRKRIATVQPPTIQHGTDSSRGWMV